MGAWGIVTHFNDPHGGSQKGGGENVCFMGILELRLISSLLVIFVCWRGLGGFASVGSRNALHVVGVTPVLHVVRSCTTVMAMRVIIIIMVGSCYIWL